MTLAASLIGYWAMDEASGNAIDAHSSNDLTETSGTIAATTGKVSGCRDFESGDTEYFTIAINSELQLGADQAWWAACWVNYEASYQFAHIMGQQTWGVGLESWVILQDGDKILLRAFGTAHGMTQVQTTVTFSSGTWALVIVYHDPTNNVIGVSMNGGTPKTAAHTTGSYISTANFSIGGSNGDGFYDGLLDEMAFGKDYVPDSTDLAWLYNSGNGRSYADFFPAVGTIIPLIMHQRKLMMAA